jgi:hypothetical protein
MFLQPGHLKNLWVLEDFICVIFQENQDLIGAKKPINHAFSARRFTTFLEKILKTAYSRRIVEIISNTRYPENEYIKFNIRASATDVIVRLSGPFRPVIRRLRKFIITTPYHSLLVIIYSCLFFFKLQI